jgi:DNA-binding transcriptional ArsR family regulator
VTTTRTANRSGGDTPSAREDQGLLGTVERLKAIADPLRIRFLLEIRDTPRTVKEVAENLAVPPTRLYYHLRILEKHGLVEVANRRMVSGIEERSYRTAAEDWRISPTLTAAALYESGALRALLDVVGSEIEVVLQSRPDVPVEDPSSPLQAIALTELALAPDEVPEMMREFEVFIRKFADRIREVHHTERLHMFYAVYPAPAALAE